MKTNTKISKQAKKKTNSNLVETIISAQKNETWKRVAEILSGPRRKMVSLNIDRISQTAKEGEVILVPGKILSQGELDKKIKVVALGFSDKAKEKLLKSKIPHSTIYEEIKNNPEAKGLRILTN